MYMEVVIIDPGETFNPTYMENGYGDARASSGTGNKIRKNHGARFIKTLRNPNPRGPDPTEEIILFPKVSL